MKYLFLLLLSISFSCNFSQTRRTSKVFVIQPLGHISMDVTKSVLIKLQQINPNTILRKPFPLPSSAYYAPRNRYRADSLIHFFNSFGNNDSVIVALTDRDISTTKNNYKDWGVLGLGYQPGNACVVSTYRLDKNKIGEQFFKVVIHELGHTEGLPHCKVKTCFMRDANGGRPLDEEVSFCTSCKSYLKKRGWILENKKG